MARIESSILTDKTLQKLGIKTYPCIQIYVDEINNGHGLNAANTNTTERTTTTIPTRATTTAAAATTKRCVASFSIPRSFLFAKMIHEALDAIDHRTHEEWNEFYDEHGNNIQFQQLALEGIIRELRKKEKQ